MKQVTLEELLEAGCHFGHEVTRQNPKAREFIFEARDNIHIINLEKTKEGLDEAAAFIRELAAKNGSLIVVGTKRQARSIVEKEVKRAKESVKKESENNIYYITNRWIGGILTNFSEVTKNFKKLKDITALLQNPEEKAKYTKKEIGLFDKERGKLESFYGGVADLKKNPDALFIIDTHLEDLAVKEALKMGVKTVGIVDTNADPLVVDYPVPANDDAVGSIELIVSYIIDNWIEGKKDSENKKQKPDELEPKKEIQSKIQKEEKPVKKEVKSKPKKTKK
ncbi:MAG: 30S ribosomal protein S2 [Patescibacteria group bacterium]|nr:30S ribosomal protein S2 [Patescibacteria group bacterium]